MGSLFEMENFCATLRKHRSFVASAVRCLLSGDVVSEGDASGSLFVSHNVFLCERSELLAGNNDVVQ